MKPGRAKAALALTEALTVPLTVSLTRSLALADDFKKILVLHTGMQDSGAGGGDRKGVDRFGGRTEKEFCAVF